MTFVLVLHILGASTWLGCNVAQAFLGSLVGNASPETRTWYSEAGEKLAKIVYNIAGILVLATGLIMVIGGDSPTGDYSFASTFISIGFVAVIIGAVLGMTVFAPKNRALAAAIRAGDEVEEAKLRHTIMAFGTLDTVVVIVTIAAMVYKVGTEFK